MRIGTASGQQLNKRRMHEDYSQALGYPLVKQLRRPDPSQRLHERSVHTIIFSPTRLAWPPNMEYLL
jgi:hypothetical protein